MTQEATKTERQAALRKAFAGKQKGSRPWLWLDDIRRNPAAIVAWIESLRQDYRASKNVRDRAEIAKLQK